VPFWEGSRVAGRIASQHCMATYAKENRNWNHFHVIFKTHYVVQLKPLSALTQVLMPSQGH
jgi:hypothetical protein